MKQTRANAKGELTKAVNRAEAVLAVGQTLDDVNVAEDRVVEAFQTFKLACEIYKSMFMGEADTEEFTVFMHEAETRFHDSRRVSEFIQSAGNYSSVREDDIGSKDSVSQIRSRTSTAIASFRKLKEVWEI